MSTENDSKVVKKRIKNEPLQPVESEHTSEWNPKSVENIIRLIDTLAKDYLQFRREDSDAKIQRLSKVAEHNRRLTYSLVIFLAALIVLMAVLTIYDKVTGDALLFLAGTVTGYIITLIQSFILSPIEEVPNPESM
jgi:hypothetical protein